MKKRLLSMLLVLIMSAGCFAGCGKKESPNEEISGEKVTLTVGIPQNSSISSYDDNALTEYIEESLNMDIKFMYFSSSDPGTQINLMCSANETLPDVLWGFQSIDHYFMNDFGEDGFFIDLTDLIDKYAVNYKEQLSKLSKQEQKVIKEKGTNASTGEFYGMPLYAASDLPDELQTMAYINKQWLDAVNMEIPTTTEELYNVLKAFKEQDPNGNGQADEIPMLSRSIESYVMNAFVYYAADNGYSVTNGKVSSVLCTDEYREGLKYLNKLCKEELFSNMSLTATSQEIKALVTPSNDVARVGVWCGNPILATATDSQILDQYVALPALSDATGKGGYTALYPKTLLYCSFITKDCKNTEAAMRFLDFFYADETTTRARYGEKGVDWQEGEGMSAYGQKAKIKVLNPNASSGNSMWGGNGNSFFTTENYQPIYDEPAGREGEVNRLLKESFEDMMEGEKPKQTVGHQVYTDEEYEIRSEIASKCYTYTNESMVKFISGLLDPNSDADWNEYVKTVKDLKMDQIVDIAQDVFDRLEK